MTSPIFTGGTYERPSFIHPRIAGVERQVFDLDQNLVLSGLRSRFLHDSQSEGLGRPTGRAASRHWALSRALTSPNLTAQAAEHGERTERSGERRFRDHLADAPLGDHAAPGGRLMADALSEGVGAVLVLRPQNDEFAPLDGAQAFALQLLGQRTGILLRPAAHWTSNSDSPAPRTPRARSP